MDEAAFGYFQGCVFQLVWELCCGLPCHCHFLTTDLIFVQATSPNAMSSRIKDLKQFDNFFSLSRCNSNLAWHVVIQRIERWTSSWELHVSYYRSRSHDAAQRSSLWRLKMFPLTLHHRSVRVASFHPWRAPSVYCENIPFHFLFRIERVGGLPLVSHNLYSIIKTFLLP